MALAACYTLHFLEDVSLGISDSAHTQTGLKILLNENSQMNPKFE